MASITIQTNGTLTVSVSDAERDLLKMVSEDQGADALNAVFNLWISNATTHVIASRFNQLSASDKSATLTALAAAKPAHGR